MTTFPERAIRDAKQDAQTLALAGVELLLHALDLAVLVFDEQQQERPDIPDSSPHAEVLLLAYVNAYVSTYLLERVLLQLDDTHIQEN